MLFRKIENEIDEWFKSDSRALLIDGARQVGKTTAILNYLNNKKIDYVSFNLILDKDALNAFETSNDPNQLLFRLSALANKELIPNKTIIFIDEIQRASDAITMIKSLNLDNKYRFIFSGSLLSLKLKNIDSIPVGYIKILKMYPMDFEEFLMANNITEGVFKHLKDSFINNTMVDEIVHEKIMELFKLYLVIGGFPKAVSEYIETNNIKNVNQALCDIDNGYKEDIGKYNLKEKLLLNDVYDLIPSELASSNKRFILKKLNEKARFYKYEETFVWFINSGIGLFTYNSSDIKYPLLENKNRTLFKLFLCDTGLLSYKLFENNTIKILNDDLSINYGSIYENFAAQELTAHGFNLYYNNDKKRGEIDFLIENEGKIIPIEIKSGNDYKVHCALDNILNQCDKEIDKAYVFSNKNVSVKNKKIYMPIYMLMFIKKEKNYKDMIYKVDLKQLDKY